MNAILTAVAVLCFAVAISLGVWQFWIRRPSNQPRADAPDAAGPATCRHCLSTDLNPAATRCPHCGKRQSPVIAAPTVIAVVATVIMLGVAIGGTVAWKARQSNNRAALTAWVDENSPTVSRYLDMVSYNTDADDAAAMQSGCSNSTIATGDESAQAVQNLEPVPDGELDAALHKAIDSLDNVLTDCAGSTPIMASDLTGTTIDANIRYVRSALDLIEATAHEGADT